MYRNIIKNKKKSNFIMFYIDILGRNLGVEEQKDEFRKN